jgi:phosphohistidine phosphatase
LASISIWSILSGMRLYLIRHAIAEDAADSGADADRALSAEGRGKMRRVAEGLAALEVRLDLVLTSPLLRARETAAIVAPRLGSPVEVLDLLAPGGDPGAIVAALRRHRALDAVALVGHQPGLGELASLLVAGSPSTSPLPFKKGGVACLEVDLAGGSRRGVLEWFLTPRQLRTLGKG